MLRALVALNSVRGYELVDPSVYDKSYSAQQSFDSKRSAKECFCGESVHTSIWSKFHHELQEQLLLDASFQGSWVHRLCGSAYPVIFRVAAVEPDDTFTLNTDCPAGVLSMVVVCAQSAALQHMAQGKQGAVHSMEPSDGLDGWGATPRVVLQEGESVGDFYGSVTLAECIDHCDRVARCMSIAHGPHGCHLKARCVEPGEPMVPTGEQGADYRTLYRKSCSGSDRHMLEMQNMIGMALRALEFCLHCLDASPWPFTLDEVLQNYALAVEAPEQFVWQHSLGRAGLSAYSGGASYSLEAMNSLAPSSQVRFTLLRLQVRWIRGLEMEAAFWRGKLSLDPEENVSLERLRRWLATGSVPWTLPGDDLCAYLADARARRALGTPRILNAGSGPLAPRGLRCEEEVPVIAADGLARFYLKVLEENQMQPPFLPVQCSVEELHLCFPPSYFDLVHMRNALDHAFDPLQGIERMLHVVKPGGWVLLRHARNEGVAGQFRNGLHQWAFDVKNSKGSEHFVIWNPDLRVDATEHLLAVGAAEVVTTLKDHPNDDAPEDEKYVWVEIRKATEQELAEKLRQNGG